MIQYLSNAAKDRSISWILYWFTVRPDQKTKWDLIEQLEQWNEDSLYSGSISMDRNQTEMTCYQGETRHTIKRMEEQICSVLKSLNVLGLTRVCETKGLCPLIISITRLSVNWFFSVLSLSLLQTLLVHQPVPPPLLHISTLVPLFESEQCFEIINVIWLWDKER